MRSTPTSEVVDPGPLPELAWLPVGKLSVDPTYQRSLESERSKALIARIAKRFRWSAFQAILAVKHGNGWRIIDGQHRVAAARYVGIGHVPAVVVVAASIAEQAQAFVQANSDRVAINPYALHHARIAAGDEAALEIADLCKHVGVVIPHYPIAGDNIKAGESMALGTIYGLVRKFGRPVALRALKAVSGSYRNEPGALRAAFFAGAADFIVEHAQAERRAAAEAAGAFFASVAGRDLLIRVAQYRLQRGLKEREAIKALIKSHASLNRAGDPEQRRRMMAGR
jgi:hypothetical protein